MSVARIVLAVLQISLVLCWENSYDGPVNFECDLNKYMMGVQSEHDNKHEDRVWAYRCHGIPSGSHFSSCTWYKHVNEYDQLLAFRCRGNAVIAGVQSVHDNHKEDRVFSFRCCTLTGVKLNNCVLTPFLNAYDGAMNYNAPPGFAIYGFDSENNDHHEDRRWKAEICQI